MTIDADELEGDECPHCGAVVLCGICCLARDRELREQWQANALREITERRKARAKRKYLARLLFKFSKGTTDV